MQDIQKKLPLLITTGEPAGIGMDIVLLLAAEGKLQDFERPIWVTADSTAMTKRADELVAADVLKNPPIWQTIDIVTKDDFYAGRHQYIRTWIVLLFCLIYLVLSQLSADKLTRTIQQWLLSS
ncbi:hypothetical protein [Psychrobacter cibarius]|uniref:hypothetical protein n=1 Tax=Psychrobacter cibarius TaxID=282669 RepID=UPI001D10FF7F|nr:hypothetical protein [Psychrobacter cibarius]